MMKNNIDTPPTKILCHPEDLEKAIKLLQGEPK